MSKKQWHWQNMKRVRVIFFLTARRIYCLHEKINKLIDNRQKAVSCGQITYFWVTRHFI